MQLKRLLELAAVLARGVCAGTIESSNGKATDTPTREAWCGAEDASG